MTKREQKIKRDAKALKAYEEQLRRKRKEYGEYAKGVAVNNRRARAFTVGEIMLKLYDNLEGVKKTKDLIDGSLFWIFSVKKLKGDDGKKYFEYLCAYRVMSQEPAYTEDEIRKEIEDTFERMMRETDEMYPEEKKDE